MRCMCVCVRALSIGIMFVCVCVCVCVCVWVMAEIVNPNFSIDLGDKDGAFVCVCIVK